MDRRSILKGMLGGLTATTAVAGAVVVSSAPMASETPTAPLPTGPVTPAEWHAEMQRLGWHVVAGAYRGQPRGVFEYCRDANGTVDMDQWVDTLPDLRRLSKRVAQSGTDFYDRAARYLFDLGLREPVGPAVRSGA